jgi:hypothetical protein
MSTLTRTDHEDISALLYRVDMQLGYFGHDLGLKLRGEAADEGLRVRRLFRDAQRKVANARRHLSGLVTDRQIYYGHQYLTARPSIASQREMANWALRWVASFEFILRVLRPVLPKSRLAVRSLEEARRLLDIAASILSGKRLFKKPTPPPVRRADIDRAVQQLMQVTGWDEKAAGKALLDTVERFEPTCKGHETHDYLVRKYRD